MFHPPDDGQKNCPKLVEFYSKNKFEKSVHLVGFIIRICFAQTYAELPYIPQTNTQSISSTSINWLKLLWGIQGYDCTNDFIFVCKAIKYEKTNRYSI